MKKLNYANQLAWSSDWNGEEVGYDDVEVVGLFTLALEGGRSVSMYVDYTTDTILEAWLDEEDE